MPYTINDLTNIAPIIAKESVIAVRENSIAARLFRFDVSRELAEKGQTVNVRIPSPIPVQDVNINVQNTPTQVKPTVIPVKLEYWKEALFSLSDKDIGELVSGIVPEEIKEAGKSLANYVDAILLQCYKDVYGFYGSPGTTPSSLVDLSGIRKILNKHLCPMTDRYLLLDVDAESKLGELEAFNNVNQSGSTLALVEGSLGRKKGFDIHMDQNMPNHTKGTLVSSSADAAVKANVSEGEKEIVIDNAGGAGTLTGTLLKGDLFTLDGLDQQFVVTEDTTASGNEIAVKFEPALSADVTDGQLFNLVDSHSVNLAFHSRAFCFATRSLPTPTGFGKIYESVVDPISGIAIRLEISHINKQFRYSLDILFGKKTIYPNLAARLLG